MYIVEARYRLSPLWHEWTMCGYARWQWSARMKAKRIADVNYESRFRKL